MQEVIIYIDGACRNNGKEGNVGAYAYKLSCGDRVKTDAVVEHNTTNNRMELMSAISALEALTSAAKMYKINVYSDSQYVVRGINEWSRGWKLKNYYGVKNDDLWRRLMGLVESFPYINFQWVQGHDKVAGNIEVDTLCNLAMDGKL